MAGRGQNTFDISTPVVQRGRGLFNIDGLVHSWATVSTREEPFEPDDLTDIPPIEPLFSTPAASGDNATQQLRDLIGELGSQVNP